MTSNGAPKIRTSAVVVVLLVAGCETSPRVPSPRPADRMAAAGDRLTYRIHLRIEGHTTALGDEALTARGQLRGQWTIDLLEAERLRGCWSEIEMLEVSLGSPELGANLSPSAAEGSCAVAQLNDRGQVEGIAHDERQPRTMRLLTELVLTELPVAVPVQNHPVASSWSSFAEGASGAGEVRYTVQERAPETIQLTRVRDAYTHLRGVMPTAPGGAVDHDAEHLYELTTSAHGLLLAIQGSERLEAEGQLQRTIVLEGRLVRHAWKVGFEDPPVHRKWMRPGEYGLSAAEAHAATAQQAGGVSLREIQDYINSLALAGPDDRHRERFHRSLGYLRLDPDAVSSVADMFFRLPVTGPARGYVLDILANLDTQVGSESFRRLLGSPEAQSREDYFADFVIRLGFIRRPDAATGRFAKGLFVRRFRETADPVSVNLALSVGALAGRLARARHPEGDGIVRLIQKTLREARNARAKSALLRALGNTGLERLTPTFVRFAAHHDPSLRYAAGIALRHAASKQVKPVLLRLALDRARAPQKAALIALKGRSLSETEISELSKAVVRGRVDSFNYSSAWSLLAPYSPTKQKTAVARTIAADPRTHAYLRAKLERFLEHGEKAQGVGLRH